MVVLVYFTLGGVGTFTKEKKLELMWINFVKERRQGFDTPPAECPPVECGQSDGATGTLDRKDRVSLGAPDAGTRSDQTLARCVRSG